MFENNFDDELNGFEFQKVIEKVILFIDICQKWYQSSSFKISHIRSHLW